MNLKQLEAFVKVAETKSFSAAAKLLYLTQPTVSAHIASLEKELNACLLVRSTKGAALSEAGKELYAYAEQMLELEQKIRERFGLGTGGRGSVLRIAASTVPSQYLLPDILSAFREQYPGEQLKVFETDSAGVVDMILTHKADVGFTGTVLEKGGCTYLPFYQDELVIITPAAERFLSRQGEDVAAWIREEPLILREEGSGTRKETARLLSQMGIDMAEFCIAAVMAIWQSSVLRLSWRIRRRSNVLSGAGWGSLSCPGLRLRMTCARESSWNSLWERKGEAGRSTLYLTRPIRCSRQRIS